MDDMQLLFEQIKADDPKKAFDVLMGALEYVLPKLARVEGKIENTYAVKEGRELHEEDRKTLEALGINLGEQNDSRTIQ